MIESDTNFFLTQISQRKTKPPPFLISKYIQGNRVLPQGQPGAGPVDLQKVPYTIEIMDCFSPHSTIKHVAVMKGAQLALTTTAEHILLYWMDAYPAAIMFTSATEAMLANWSSKRLEPAIDSVNIRHKMVAKIEGNAKSKQTGDKMMSKTFHGGSLVMSSAQSPGNLRSESIRVLVRDEIDAAPKLLRTGEGNWLSVSEARTVGHGPNKKILDFSTPTTVEDSSILVQYKKGDQRKYEVPCPFCDEFQFLEFGGEKERFGLKPEFDEHGHLKNVYYECQHCHGEIQNYHKTKMLAAGRWVPTAKSYDPNYRSYHVSSLYSPVGMFSWSDFYQTYLIAKVEQGGMRAFTNVCMGLPYRERGSRPKIEHIIGLRGDYEMGQIPYGILFLTAAIDVQAGSAKDPARLELEVKGHGRYYKSWSIEYKTFVGEVDNITGGAWAKLYEWLRSGGGTYKSKSDRKFNIMAMFVDSGYNTSTVYNFCKSVRNTYPVKGSNSLNKKLAEEGDIVTNRNFAPIKATKIDSGAPLINIATNHYKREIYNNLNSSYLHKLKENEYTSEAERLMARPAGFMDFPVTTPQGDYDIAYFDQLSAEEMLANGSFVCAQGRRNEALDITVYNSAACDYFVDLLVFEERERYKARGASLEEIKKITKYVILEKMELEIYGSTTNRVSA